MSPSVGRGVEPKSVGRAMDVPSEGARVLPWAPRCIPDIGVVGIGVFAPPPDASRGFMPGSDSAQHSLATQRT